MKQIEKNNQMSEIMTMPGTVKEYMSEKDYAIVVNENGSFQGIIGPTQLVDFDQLPDAVAKILTALYGDVFDITFDRKLQ